MSVQDQALQHLLGVLREANADNPRVRQLAMQWPSLAAALGNLLLAHEMHPAPPLRRAANEERMPLIPMATDGERLVMPAQPPDWERS